MKSISTDTDLETDTSRGTIKTTTPYSTTKHGKLFRRVNVDPRAVAFIIGRNHGNRRKMGCNVKDQNGKSIYIKYVQPERYQWGFFKLTSESNETLDLGERLLKAKESEFLKLFQEGRLAPAFPRAQPNPNPSGRRFDGISPDQPRCPTNYHRYQVDANNYLDKSVGWAIPVVDGVSPAVNGVCPAVNGVCPAVNGGVPSPQGWSVVQRK